MWNRASRHCFSPLLTPSAGPSGEVGLQHHSGLTMRLNEVVTGELIQTSLPSISGVRRWTSIPTRHQQCRRSCWEVEFVGIPLSRSSPFVSEGLSTKPSYCPHPVAKKQWANSGLCPSLMSVGTSGSKPISTLEGSEMSCVSALFSQGRCHGAGGGRGAELPAHIYVKMAVGVTAYFCWGRIIGDQREAELIHHSAILLQLNQGATCLKRKKNRIQSLLIWYPKCSGYNQKVTYHTKNQEDHNMNERRPSTDTKKAMNQMMEWSDKNFKATIIKMLQQSIPSSLQTNETV